MKAEVLRHVLLIVTLQYRTVRCIIVIRKSQLRYNSVLVVINPWLLLGRTAGTSGTADLQ